MSVKAVAWAYEQRVGCPVKKAVLVAIADVADDEGYCWPSVSLIAFKAEIHARTVQRHIRYLESVGLCEVQRDRTRPNGSSSSNAYRLPILMRHLFPDEREVKGGDKSPPSGNLPPSGKSPSLARGRGEGGSGVTPYERLSEPVITSTRARKAEAGTLIPDDFGISPQIREWARRQGWEPYLDLHLGHFLDYVRGGAQGGKPVLAIDWEAKFRSCIRADWGDVRMKAQREARVQQRAGGNPAGKWKPGGEPAHVLNNAAERLGLKWHEPPHEGETHGQFRQRIVDAGGANLLKPGGLA